MLFLDCHDVALSQGEIHSHFLKEVIIIYKGKHVSTLHSVLWFIEFHQIKLLEYPWSQQLLQPLFHAPFKQKNSVYNSKCGHLGNFLMKQQICVFCVWYIKGIISRKVIEHYKGAIGA